jgi:hypothetical protein
VTPIEKHHEINCTMKVILMIFWEVHLSQKKFTASMENAETDLPDPEKF